VAFHFFVSPLPKSGIGVALERLNTTTKLRLLCPDFGRPIPRKIESPDV